MRAVDEATIGLLRTLSISAKQMNGPSVSYFKNETGPSEINKLWNVILESGFMYWIGLDLFNDDTRPTEHISRPTEVGSLTLYNLWQFLSDRRIRLFVKIHYASLGNLLKEGLQRVSSVVFIPNFLQSCTFQEHVVNGQRLSSGQDMGLRGLGMTNSKPGDDNIFSSG